MTQEKRSVYLVKVKGHPGHGARTYNKAYAEETKKLLERQYKSVRIVEKKVQ